MTEVCKCPECGNADLAEIRVVLDTDPEVTELVDYCAPCGVILTEEKAWFDEGDIVEFEYIH